ncbi:TauD/TfdA family dioxygenase [Vibrio mangrovi]|uniref:Clavaminate synthase 1 n=1 Tax=Vibrio mangrovi TaxID=474394 RepID=A0A1Y6IW26_9VIBR|nr:TauD/TfdA family dioxygenase [Vibrio mangrovi]MDW6005060.1 TauD/TfdA family dioxygenase [Vibrio mangrovi]SMS01828.1 Clavaminate synthase 1 [Vibrio mangrovi]
MKDFSDLMKLSLENVDLCPKTIAEILMFKCFGNRDGFLLIEDLDIGQIPLTPTDRSRLSKEDNQSEKLLLQCAALLGEAIGYVQESNGELINNFFPHQTAADHLTSDSFDSELDLHTENAFHAISPDYLLLLCLRQDPDQEAETYISSINNIFPHITEDEKTFFLQEKYNFLSDYCQSQKNCKIDINKRETVLYGDHKNPYFRFDPQFMIALNAESHLQMNKLRDIAWQVAKPVKLKAGSLLIIDNKKTAHARSKFKAYFDGSDRWIQRAFTISNKKYINEKLNISTNIYELIAEI